jgi:hypothetical protein
VSRRGRVAIVTLVVVPLLAVGGMVLLLYATKNFAVSLVVTLVVAGLVSALATRRLGYGDDEPGRVAGWTVGSVGVSLLAIVIAVLIVLAILVSSCEGDCFG